MMHSEQLSIEESSYIKPFARLLKNHKKSRIPRLKWLYRGPTGLSLGQRWTTLAVKRVRSRMAGQGRAGRQRAGALEMRRDSITKVAQTVTAFPF